MIWCRYLPWLPMISYDGLLNHMLRLDDLLLHVRHDYRLRHHVLLCRLLRCNILLIILRWSTDGSCCACDQRRAAE
jgi:hypothetical protein